MSTPQRPEVVVITGASAGVGRATAQAFARRAAHVGLLARGREGLEGARRDVEALGGRALVLPTDVADAGQVEAAAVALVHVAGNLASESAPRFVHNLLSPLVDPPRRTLLHRAISFPDYPESEISPYFRVNGYPPIAEYAAEQGGDETYERLRQGDFADYRLEVTGLVETPLSLSLDDLRALPREEQITMHNCIQGWTAVGKWAGVRLAEVLDRCKPLPGARYLVFHSYQFHKESGVRY